MGWAEQALAAWRCADPVDKCRLTLALPEPDAPCAGVTLGLDPGRPARPELVHPAAVPRRRLGGTAGRIALIHAIAHIEFNAINLALDASLRFAGLPLAYYRDWISVAMDEARHHRMLVDRLAELGAGYGELPAHNGLWEMAQKTADDPLLRMALVPRVLEARGLDVTPGMIERLRQTGDEATVSCLELILEEEVRHVAIGSRWFRYLCAQRQLEPVATFQTLLREHMPERSAGPLNRPARLAAGFSADELALLCGEA